MSAPYSYTQPGFQPPAIFHLSDQDYEKARAIVKACVDGLLFFFENGEPIMVLARRKIKPMLGQFWFIGGRRIPGDISKRHRLVQKFKEEIGLTVGIHRIPPAPEIDADYEWAEDGWCASAPVFFVKSSRAEYKRMQSKVNNSPEFSEIAAVPAHEVKRQPYPEVVQLAADILISKGHLDSI